MQAYQQGETDAFEILLKRYERGIYYFSLRFLGNRMQAEEVTQEAFLRVIKAAARYKPISSFRNYLYQIARNHCFDLLRKRSKDKSDAGGWSDPTELPGAAHDTNPSPEDHAIEQQRRQALLKALQRLPPEQKEVFLLKEIKDMKLQDVASITGANINTVKSRLRYALFTLREQLSREGIN